MFDVVLFISHCKKVLINPPYHNKPGQVPLVGELQGNDNVTSICVIKSHSLLQTHHIVRRDVSFSRIPHRLYTTQSTNSLFDISSVLMLQTNPSCVCSE